MSFEFGIWRILIFVACMATLVLIGGFDPPEMAYVARGRTWGTCLMGFIIGAVSVSFVEHSVGHMEPRTNLRLLYVLLGSWLDGFVRSLLSKHARSVIGLLG